MEAEAARADFGRRPAKLLRSMNGKKRKITGGTFASKGGLLAAICIIIEVASGSC